MNQLTNNTMKGFTVWMTGLPFTGKKAAAEALAKRLEALGYKTELLIGGAIRRIYDKDLGYSKQEIFKNIRRIAFECKMLSENGIVAIAVTISPYKELRLECRNLIERFYEVYFKCGIDVLKKRDSKGLFKKAEEGLVKNVAGISIPYEESDNVEMVVDAEKANSYEISNSIILGLIEQGFLEEADSSILLKKEEQDIRNILRKTWFK